VSLVLVVTVVVFIISEKVTEIVDDIETEVYESEGEVEETVGGVVSPLVSLSVSLSVVPVVLTDPSSAYSSFSSPQEMKKMRLKRNMEHIMSVCFISLPIISLGKRNVYHVLGEIYNI